MTDTRHRPVEVACTRCDDLRVLPPVPGFPQSVAIFPLANWTYDDGWVCGTCHDVDPPTSPTSPPSGDRTWIGGVAAP